MAKTETLTDDFSTEDGAKWDYAAVGGDAHVTGGQLHVDVQSGVASVNTYDLTSSYIYFEIVDRGSTTPDESAGIIFGDFGTFAGLLMFSVNGSDLALNDLFVGVLDSVPYNATAHRWIRLRESGGTVFGDVSADGISWGNAVSATYAAGTNWGVNVIGTGAVFDNFNTTGGTPPPANTGAGFFGLL